MAESFGYKTRRSGLTALSPGSGSMMETGHVIHTFTLSSQPRNFGRHAATSENLFVSLFSIETSFCVPF